MTGDQPVMPDPSATAGQPVPGQEPEPARIWLYPIDIGRYRQRRAYPDLDVAGEVETLQGLLADFGARTVPWDVAADARGADAIDTRLADLPRRTTGSPTVLDWAGHGWSDGDAAVLVHAYSPAQPDPGSTILPQALACALTARQKDPASTGTWLIVIIDACHSARFAALLDAHSRHRPDGPDNFMIVGVSGDGPTRLGRFTGVLERCLRNTFRANDQINVWDLAGELSRRLFHGEVAVRRVHDATMIRRTPVAALNAPLDVLDLLETALAALSDDERRHYLARAQGGDGLFTATGELSWYFQGRRDETRTIVDWLDASRGGMLVVTGPPGCGKSALLGHLLIQTRRALREILTRARVLEVDPAVPRPPDDVFDVALLLTGATILDVLSRLAAALGFGVLPQADPNRQVGWLCERLVKRAATRPVTLLVDALDEAIAPVTMARTVMAVLAEVPGVRLVVGTRRSTTEGPDQPDPDNRDLLDALAHRRPPTILLVPREVRRMRYICRVAAWSSGMLLSPSVHTTVSKQASPNGSAWASAKHSSTSTPSSSARRRAPSSMRQLRSTPVSATSAG